MSNIALNPFARVQPVPALPELGPLVSYRGNLWRRMTGPAEYLRLVLVDVTGRLVRDGYGAIVTAIAPSQAVFEVDPWSIKAA